MPNWFRSITFRAILGLFFAVQMYICSINVEVYQFAEQKDYPFFDKDKVELYSWFRWNYKTFQKPYESITPYLREIGIQSDDKVISIPDPTFNYTLYLMNQPGWTSIQHQALNKAQIKELGEDMDAGYDFQDLIERGAKYLIVGRNGEYDKAKFKKIETYLKYPIGEYENIKIYDLHEYSN